MAQHKKVPRRRYIITNENTGKRKVIVSRKFAREVVTMEYFDIDPRVVDVITDYHLRFFSPRWGFIDVTWGENQD